MITIIDFLYLILIIFFVGKTGVIYNGVPNWIYANDPELSLNNNNFMQFSPNGKYLTYVTFNDSEVNEYRQENNEFVILNFIFILIYSILQVYLVRRYISLSNGAYTALSKIWYE